MRHKAFYMRLNDDDRTVDGDGRIGAVDRRDLRRVKRVAGARAQSGAINDSLGKQLR